MTALHPAPPIPSGVDVAPSGPARAAASLAAARPVAARPAPTRPAPARPAPARPALNRPPRDTFVDGVRVIGTLLVVALHWIMVEATWDGQTLVVGNALAHGSAWLLTWLQPLPILFFAAGAAARYDLIRHPAPPGSSRSRCGSSACSSVCSRSPPGWSGCCTATAPVCS
jgi:hypothetical protein